MATCGLPPLPMPREGCLGVLLVALAPPLAYSFFWFAGENCQAEGSPFHLPVYSASLPTGLSSSVGRRWGVGVDGFEMPRSE